MWLGRGTFEWEPPQEPSLSYRDWVRNPLILISDNSSLWPPLRTAYSWWRGPLRPSSWSAFSWVPGPPGAALWSASSLTWTAFAPSGIDIGPSLTATGGRGGGSCEWNVNHDIPRPSPSGHRRWAMTSGSSLTDDQSMARGPLITVDSRYLRDNSLDSPVFSGFRMILINQIGITLNNHVKLTLWIFMDPPLHGSALINPFFS